MSCACMSLVSLLIMALSAGPAAAWSHAGRWDTASGGYHSYGGADATYHPPTAVNDYGSSCDNCGG